MCVLAYADEFSSSPYHHAEILSSYVIIDQSPYRRLLATPSTHLRAFCTTPDTTFARPLWEIEIFFTYGPNYAGLQVCLLWFYPTGAIKAHPKLLYSLSLAKISFKFFFFFLILFFRVLYRTHLCCFQRVLFRSQNSRQKTYFILPCLQSNKT